LWRIVCTSVRPPGVNVVRFVITSSTTASGKPFSNATRSRSAGSNAIPLGDGGDMRLEADIVGELVDAFLADHGRVHVGGNEQPLAPPCGRLHHNVDRLVVRRTT
jgi:hypothetical protein